MHPYFFILTLFCTGLLGAQTFDPSNPLHQLLEKHPEYFKHLTAHPERYEIQIIYTQIDRDAANIPSFKNYTFNLDNNRYFYPASTVKMPLAFLALEKINQLKIIGLDKYSNMQTGAGHLPQTPITIDSTSENLLPSLAHYIKKIFVVSDNDAFNRLYEFLGQHYINDRLRAKGFTHSRIVHRLGAGGPSYNQLQNRYTNPVSFYRADSLLYHQGEVHSTIDFELELSGEQRGVGYFKNDSLQKGAFDFSLKNFIALKDLHDMLQAVIFPESVAASSRFELTESDYRFLYQCMSTKPRESIHPKYDEPDAYVKFFVYGGEAERIPDSVRIFNKVGWAYGFLTDASYFVDFESNVEFLLSAVIHVNEDQIYNDDNYEYESTGLPFFKNLGNVIYEFEKERKRVHTPKLSRFRIDKYD